MAYKQKGWSGWIKKSPIEREGHKYTGSSDLIKGSRDGHKNWDNVPGIYAGLDKLADSGEEVMKKAVEDKDKG